MGYEIKLKIGAFTRPDKEWKEGSPILEDGQVGYPLLQDKKGNFIATGRTELSLMQAVEIDLCCVGSGALMKLIEKSKVKKKSKKVYKWWEGNRKEEEDLYGSSFKPVSINAVLKAIEADNVKEQYRRFDWAVALLKSMKISGKEMQVIFYGH